MKIEKETTNDYDITIFSLSSITYKSSFLLLDLLLLIEDYERLKKYI